MEIHWFTTRKMTDLCSTTQRNLAHGLCSKGHDLTIYNADMAEMNRDNPWSHQPLSQSGIKGFHARSLANSAKKYIANITSGIAIVDWTMASKLAPLLQRNKIPWLLMDRSPPANSGLLALFQWPIWKKSWRLVLRGKAHNGFTVSSTHSKFVCNQMGIELNKVTALEAGVDLELFSTGQKSKQFTLLYHGRLDKNRGVLVLTKLIEKLNQGNIAAKLQLIGEGDAFTELQAIANHRDDIEVLPSMSQTKLVQYLSKAHIGLLPMPEVGVWALASPLKRSEYAASGLAILGIDHSGHRLGQEQVEWMKLVGQQQLIEEGAKWLQMLANDNSKMTLLAIQARKYAEENMSWHHSVDAMDEVINSIAQ